ncbi:hypothetical protein KEM54_002159 [Ascosphaera aggregata]|nr:hypothetical protein KEM54_002159 [Ascosphaera aggregata]
MAGPSSLLRAVTHRLNATPVKELPSVAAYLASGIADCRDILSTAHSSRGSSQEVELAQLVQKLKARITSLLQDKTAEGRWCAVVILKGTIEAGQWEILRDCANWIRCLLSILGRPDPYSTKKLCIITLTRIFQLTHPYPTLVRELTTPNLSAFITTCLNQVSVKSSSGQQRNLIQYPVLLEIVLRSFLELIGHHPTTFRPFSSQIHGILVPLLSASSSQLYSTAALNYSQELFVALHSCAPKNTSAEEWLKACRSTLATSHQTADYLFRAVIEQWESTDPNFKHTSGINNSAVVGDSSPNPLGLSSWQGIGSGALRLKTLIALLSKFTTTPSHSTISIPVGAIVDLTSRLISINAPSGNEDIGSRPDIGKDEKASLWGELPSIHEAALNLLQSLIRSSGFGAIPVLQTALDQASWAFKTGQDCCIIRTAVYQLVSDVIPVIGPSMTKVALSSLVPIVRSACRELLSSAMTNTPTAPTKSSGGPKQKVANADAFLLNPSLNDSTSSASSASPELRQAACRLMQVTLTHLPAEIIPPSLRTEIDRVAILTGDHTSMLASVLNPATNMSGQQIQPSLMPFLARDYSSALDVEGLLRPRLPVIAGPPQAKNTDYEEEDVQTMQDYPAGALQASFKSSTVTVGKRTLPEDQEQDGGIMDIDRESPKRARVEARLSNASEVGEPFTAPAAVITPSMPQAAFTTPTPATGTAVTIPEKASEKPVSISTEEDFKPTQPAASAESTNVSVANPTMPAADVAAVASQADDDDSDDEIPTLNIESDSDEVDDVL